MTTSQANCSVPGPSVNTAARLSGNSIQSTLLDHEINRPSVQHDDNKVSSGIVSFIRKGLNFVGCWYRAARDR